MAKSERRLADNFWDLRDDAYDHPERWNGVTAEAVFERLVELVEESEERGAPVDWQKVKADVLAWRGNV